MNTLLNLEVILVEDNLSDAELARHSLKKNKLVNNILHLQDGEEAIDFMFGRGSYAGLDLNNKPCLILPDLKMPRLSGLKVLRMLKNDTRTKNIPVVVITSSKENSL